MRQFPIFIQPVPYLPGYLGLGCFLFQRSQFLSSGPLHATRGGSAGKESACNAGDLGSIPGLGRSPGEANGNPLQYSCLGSPMDRGAWRATVLGVTKVGHNVATK